MSGYACRNRFGQESNESYFVEVSTRKVKKIFSKFGLHGVSASEASSIAKKQVTEFLSRPIEVLIRSCRHINKALLIVLVSEETAIARF